jgi:acyl carrier protein
MKAEKLKNSPPYVAVYGEGNVEPADSQKQLPNAEAIEAWLLRRLSEVLKVKPEKVDVRLPFASYGLGSVQAVSLATDLADWLGRDLPATLVWDYPNIEALAKAVAEDRWPEGWNDEDLY